MLNVKYYYSLAHFASATATNQAYSLQRYLQTVVT